jgi:catechol 2,3-dioxygenase-like lactoylglutathione lyase family enzyme
VREGSEVAHGVSHVGIGVTNLDRAIAFYEGVLGFRLVDRYGYYVPSDPSHADRPLAQEDERRWREVALLRVGDREDDPVVVLSVPARDTSTTTLDIDDVGTHHLGFWVTAVGDYVERLERHHVVFTMPLRTFENARGWGVPSTVVVRSCIFRDPDGTLLQLDEQVTAEIQGGAR